MPEHVHLLVYPRTPSCSVSQFLKALKEPVARQAVEFLKQHSPNWLSKIRVKEGSRTRHRFWQPGGGYDRNGVEVSTLHSMIDYIHANPVRRGLVERPEDWLWSSATWYAGLRPVAIEIDGTLPTQFIAGQR